MQHGKKVFIITNDSLIAGLFSGSLCRYAFGFVRNVEMGACCWRGRQLPDDEWRGKLTLVCNTRLGLIAVKQTIKTGFSVKRNKFSEWKFDKFHHLKKHVKSDLI